jgi:isoleucyl-tRNA synthetase
MRKEAGLAVSDRIRLGLSAEAEVEAAAREHREYIAGEVLARLFRVGDAEGADDASDPTLHHAALTFDLDGRAVRVIFSKDET